MFDNTKQLQNIVNRIQQRLANTCSRILSNPF